MERKGWRFGRKFQRWENKMTNTFGVFDGKRRLFVVQDDLPQMSVSRRNKPRPVESRWQEKRLVLRFVRGFSVEQVAAWEKVRRLEVQQAIRQALAELNAPKVIEMPLPRRIEKAA